MISSSESEIKIKTIYTKKKSNKVKINEQKEEIKNYKDDGDIKNNDDRNINDRYDKNNNNAIKENLDENLNIKIYKRKFFDRLSSIGPKSNINKSMDNKNSSIIEELEVVGLSQNEILKDKLSEFFVGTSIGSSSISNQNNSSMHNNYHKNRPKSEISGVNRELISSSKSNNENVKGINSINYKSINGNNEEREKKNDTGGSGQKYDTEETINNKETGRNTNEKYKENNGENINERKMLKNNRNKSYFVLQDYSSMNSQFKELEN